MKKFVCLILIAITVISLVAVTVSAADTTRSGIEFQLVDVGGKTQSAGYYISDKRLEHIPVTLEAWVYIPKTVYSSRAGIILANYVGFKKDDFFTFEIHQNGVPRLVFSDISGEMKDFKFPKATIPADTWTHLAIVYGTGFDNKQIYCYINGVMKQSTNANLWYQAAPATVDNPLCLGGDLRTLNEQYFQGSLGDVAVYSDVRTPEEIRADYEGKPDVNDDALMVYYDLSEELSGKNIADISGNGYDMTYYRTWLDEDEMQAIRDAVPHKHPYSIAFLPDIQYSTQNFPDKLAVLYDYLLDNAESKKIKYVIGLGDITNRNTDAEWKTIFEQTQRLNGVLPYSLVRGNHDITYNNYAELFDATYGKPGKYYYEHVKQNGGFMTPASAKNTYLLFEVGDVEYIIINLDFGATDDILQWAGSVLEQYPDRRAIIATHGYFNADATTLDAGDYAAPSTYSQKWNDGDDMWEKLICKYENIDLVVSGHIGQDDFSYSTAEGNNGNDVHQMLIDTQSVDKVMEGLGFVAMMYFTEDGNIARTECYSTVLKKYFRETNALITLDFGGHVHETESPETTPSDPTHTVTTPSEQEQTTPADNAGGCGGALQTVLVVPLMCTMAGAALLGKKRASRPQRNASNWLK